CPPRYWLIILLFCRNKKATDTIRSVALYKNSISVMRCQEEFYKSFHRRFLQKFSQNFFKFTEKTRRKKKHERKNTKEKTRKKKHD
ncbi:MAG: hypothetical protein ACI4ER_01285, partial [Suilimivivens sp.]